jgi:hypothetical protein
MYYKLEIRERLINIFFIVVLIITMVVWYHYQGMDKMIEIRDLIHRNTMSATDLILRFSIYR